MNIDKENNQVTMTFDEFIKLQNESFQSGYVSGVADTKIKYKLNDDNLNEDNNELEKSYHILLMDCHNKYYEEWTDVLGIYDDEHLQEAIDFHIKIYSNKRFVTGFSIRDEEDFEINSFYAV